MNRSHVFPHRVLLADRSPVLGETTYDRTTSALWALFVALVLLSGWLISVWLHLVPATESSTTVVFTLPLGPVESDGLNEARVATLEQILVPDASPDRSSDVIDHRNPNLTDLIAAVSASPAVESAANSVSRTSGAGGTENVGQLRGLLGQRRESNWLIEFSEPQDLDDYCKMLDHFGIELGVVFPNGTATYLRRFSQLVEVRHSDDFRSDKRFFTEWAVGNLRAFDSKLFEAAGVSTSGGRIIQFYAADTERSLEEKERRFAGRRPQDIRRTWFLVTRFGGTYEFEVTRQLAR